MQIAQSLVQVLANNALKEYGGDLAIGAMTIIDDFYDATVWSKPRITANHWL